MSKRIKVNGKSAARQILYGIPFALLLGVTYAQEKRTMERVEKKHGKAIEVVDTADEQSN